MNFTTQIQYIGQAGYKITSKTGQTLAIDLYLSDIGEQIEGHIEFKRLLPFLFEPKDLNLDYLIATHAHFDHFDPPTIEAFINLGTTIIASVTCKDLVAKMKLSEESKDKVVYVKPGDKLSLGDFDISIINCDHGESAPDAFGVIIEVDNVRICEAGDTCLRFDRVDEYNSLGMLDVFIGPINGAYGNMNEKEFAALCGAVKPNLAIPCHYGMFAAHGGNPGVFCNEMNENYSDVKYTLLRMGEQLEF